MPMKNLILWAASIMLVSGVVAIACSSPSGDGSYDPLDDDTYYDDADRYDDDGHPPDDDDNNNNDNDDDTATPPYEPPAGLEAVFYDVGQGDAALIRFPAGSTMLIDGGPNDSGDEVILPHFHDLHLAELTYLVVTHPDSDHCGGLDEVVEEVDVEEVWENGQSKDTSSWQDFSQSVDDHGISRRTVHRGYQTTIDGCQLLVLSADQGWSDVNANSIVLSITCEGASLLFTGDATEQTQEDLIAEFGNDLQAEVVKVSHHGSPDRSPAFPGYVEPDVAVASVGAGNPYGHPDPEVVEEWEATGAVFYRTDQDGTVTVSVDGGQLSVETEN